MWYIHTSAGKMTFLVVKQQQNPELPGGSDF